MLELIFANLFGCHHRNTTFPISTRTGTRRTGAARPTGTYIVCLDCGREFPYDWKQMRVVSTYRLAARLVSEAVEEQG
jgi:hypothetical protein